MRKKIFTMLAVLGAVVITVSTTPSANAQNVPLVYNAENTGIDCPLPPLPTVNQLPSIIRLPDPFKMEDGNRIASFDQWECRRNEIKAQIENYEIGVRPNRPADISATYINGTLTVIVNDKGKTVTLTSKVTMPTSGTAPFPIIIGMNSPTGSLPSSIFEGCIQIPFMHDQVSVYGSSPQSGPFYAMYPELAAAGQYCAWAWGVSRLIDGIELVQKDMNADIGHIGVTGCSYAGKMALYAGAFDERIALTIAQESGGGGTASWRVSETLGSVENLSSTNYSWFMQTLKDNFDKKVDKLPYDHHELIAMIAPRAFLALGNDILWLADESGYVSCMAAKEVWQFMAVPDRMGFDLTGGHNHCSPPNSQVASATSFVDRFLRGNEDANTNIAINNYTKTNYQFWISDWANVTEPNVPLENYWYEGESVADDCTSIGNDFTTGDDTNASNGSYVIEKDGLSSIDAAPGSNGLIAIPFTINNHRDFHIYFRVNCSNDGSLWIKIDDGSFASYNVLNTNGEWKWVNIVNPTLLAGTGNHTLTIGYRSGGIKLDKINITNDPTQVPDGIGEKETECIQIPPCSIIDFETGNINGWIKQNPGGGIDITQEDKHSGEYAMKMISRGGSAWSVQAFSPAFDMISGHTYNVTFWVRAVDGGGRGRISTTGAGQLGSSQYWADFNVGNEWQKISYTNLAAGGSSIQLAFDMGYVAKTYYIDDIVLEDITVAPQPALKVQNTSWDAGEVAINESLQSGKFSIRNIGTGTLDVAEITELSAPWSTTLNVEDGLSLGAGQVQEFTFTYAPTMIGTSATNFTIETNAGNTIIGLRGNGIESTDIPHIGNQDVKIFSSPGKISITAPENSTVRISDMVGKTIRTYNMYKSPLELSMHSGVYVVNVEYGSKTYTQKVIV